MKLFRKCYFLFIIVFLLSSCTTKDSINNEQPIKVIEVESKSEKIKATSNDTTIKEFKVEKPVYYNNYKVTLEVDTATRIVTGIEKINYKNTTDVDLNNIYFHLYLNAFNGSATPVPYFNQFEPKIFKYGKDTGAINIKSVHINNETIPFEQDGTILKLNLLSGIKKEEEIEIILQFESYIPKIAHRTGANDKAMWFGNYLPILCKYDDNGWRTDPYYPAGDPFYSDIANYEVKISTPKGYEVVGTGDEEVIEADNKKITTITAEMVRDFAFAISKYYKTKTVTTEDNININFYYYSDDIFNIDEMLRVAKESIKYYNTKLGSYPYSELDIIEADLFLNSGGMEYPTFVIVDSSYLKKQSSINSIVHEIGHQWIYNIIGNDQINEAWIDEGLNSYLQFKFLYSPDELDKRLESEYRTLNSKINNIYPYTLNSNLKEFEDWNSYYNIEYIRSRLMFYSLNQRLGDDMFDNLLKLYYKKYSFKTVSTDDFIALASEISGENLQDFFDSWIKNKSLPDLER